MNSRLSGCRLVESNPAESGGSAVVARTGWGNAMSGKRWVKKLLAGWLAFSSAGGCKQQLFLEPADYKDALRSALPRGLESEPHSTIVPSQVDRISDGPGDVIDT